tara:strand:- start:8 stop:160 length:153 start_codon:yes stop_codon:yes gene_type:complete
VWFATNKGNNMDKIYIELLEKYIIELSMQGYRGHTLLNVAKELANQGAKS